MNYPQSSSSQRKKDRPCNSNNSSTKSVVRMRSKYDTGQTLDVESLYPINLMSQYENCLARASGPWRRYFSIPRLVAHIIHNGGERAGMHGNGSSPLTRPLIAKLQLSVTPTYLMINESHND